VLAFLAPLAIAACEDTSSRLVEPEAAPPPIRAYVTPEVAAQLTPEGRFRIDDPPLPTEAPTIDARRAGEQALAYVRTLAPHFGQDWERGHGGPIDYARLAVDPRIFLAASPYGPIPEGSFHSAYRRAWGPFYIVRLTSGGEPAIVVAVSVFNTDVTVERGRAIASPFGGNEFFASGIPADPERAAVVSPEQAVHDVGRRLDVRVVRSPALVGLGHHERQWSPVAPLWRLWLDREVAVRGRKQGAARRSREIYIGHHGRFFLPTGEQPATQRSWFMTGPPWPGPTVPVEIPVNPGSVVRYEEVVPETDQW
jgi:hypothetical protein